MTLALNGPAGRRKPLGLCTASGTRHTHNASHWHTHTHTLAQRVFKVHSKSLRTAHYLLPPATCALAAGGPDPASHSPGAQATEPVCAQLDLPYYLCPKPFAPSSRPPTKKYLHRTLYGHHTELSIKPFLVAARLSAEAQGKSGIPVDTYRFHKKFMITEVELKPPYCYFDVEDNFEIGDDEWNFLPYGI